MGVFPFISVILPVFQVEKYIESCLSSIGYQDYSGAIECLIVDDCGNDASMAIVQSFLDNYKGSVLFRILRHDCNKGLSAARNTGIRHSSGDYILFVDSDDSLPLDALNSLAEPLQSERYDFVVGKCKALSHKNGEIITLGVTDSLPDRTVLYGQDILDSFFCRKFSITVWNKLIKASFIKDNNLLFYEGIVFEDDLWSFQSSVVAQSLCVVDKITYYYTVREDSITTSTMLQRRVDCTKRIMYEMYQFAAGHNLANDSRCHDWIERYRVGLFIRLIENRYLFRESYCSLRALMRMSWLDSVKMNKFNLLKQVRDFHLALPIHFGADYFFLYLYLYLNLKVKK